ncbi:hypothetical protein QJS10_CPB20g00871 [Acorus calamus]|uniref:Dirigent protein n=1 Tax=Acorus calamus TaxID=4465 RepID=A0AAV9CAV2_ACOCL|nr:hypothetical protein QJS10_CPB20g00871 [Acorus calamus]
MTNPTTILTLLLLTITTHRATSARHLLLDEAAVPPSNAPLTTTTEPTTTPPAAPTTPITTTLSPPPPVATDPPAPLTFFMHDVLIGPPNPSTTASTTINGGFFGGGMTVIDDELTGSAELGSGTVGKAQGFCVASAEEGTSKTVAFTAMFEEGGYADSLSFFGVQRTVGAAAEESRVAVMGGTGKYIGAKGYATVRGVVTGGGGENVTDGVGTLLQFSVYLAY